MLKCQKIATKQESAYRHDHHPTQHICTKYQTKFWSLSSNFTADSSTLEQGGGRKSFFITCTWANNDATDRNTKKKVFLLCKCLIIIANGTSEQQRWSEIKLALTRSRQKWSCSFRKTSAWLQTAYPKGCVAPCHEQSPCGTAIQRAGWITQALMTHSNSQLSFHIIPYRVAVFAFLKIPVSFLTLLVGL